MTELLLDASLRGASLVTAVFNDGSFEYRGKSSRAGPNSTLVFVCLRDDGRGRQRGHFERMWPTAEFEHYLQAYSTFERERRMEFEIQTREQRRMAKEDVRVVLVQPAEPQPTGLQPPGNLPSGHAPANLKPPGLQPPGPNSPGKGLEKPTEEEVGAGEDSSSSGSSGDFFSDDEDVDGFIKGPTFLMLKQRGITC